MRKILFAIAVLTQVASAAPVEKVYSPSVQITQLQKTEVKYDRTLKAWFLEIVGDMASPDWRSPNPPPSGVTLLLHRPALTDPYDRGNAHYRLELGVIQDHKGVLQSKVAPAPGTPGFTGFIGMSFQFEAKIRLPANFSERDRVLRITVPSRSAYKSGIPMLLAWDFVNKTWSIGYGATETPILVNNPNPLVRIDRFATTMADFTPTKLELKAATDPVVALDGTYGAVRCPGNEKAGEVAAMAMSVNEPQLALLQTHQAKDDILDPFADACERDTKQLPLEMEARFPVGTKGEIDGRIADTGRYFLNAKVFGNSMRNSGTQVGHSLTLDMKKGSTDWTMQAFEEYLQP